MKAGISGLIALLVLAAAAWLAIIFQEPPHPDRGDVPARDFSAVRAMAHVEAIAERPHPIGSADHARVRQYIVGQLKSLGLEPELHETTAIFARDSIAGRVSNILVRLKGKQSTRAVLLVAHYDSVPSGPGAGDDASGVAVLLETLRALKSRPPLQNDVIALVTDGEEVGLLGAAAFTAEHPWAKEVGVVLNFEARGNRGPAMMFETSAGNAAWIDVMHARVHDPRSSSLTQAVYQRMPNDTDLTVFKEAGLAGLNFAFIGNLEAYHTRLDTPANLSLATLEQQGRYALSMARGAGNSPLPLPARSDATYFNTFGSGLAVYSQALSKTLSISASAFALIVLVLAIRRRQVTIASLALALLVLPVTTAATIGSGFLLVALARWMHATLVPPGPILLSGWYAGAVAAVAVVVAATLVALLRRRVTGTALSIGTLAWWIVLALLTAAYLPGGNFLFLWPSVLLAFAVLTGLWWAPGTAPGIAAQILALLFLALAVVLVAPIVYSFHVAFPLHSLGTIVLATFAAISFVLIVEPLYRTVAAFGWHAAAAAAAAVAVLFIGGLVFTRYSAEHPKVSNLWYLLDADAGRAFWATRESTANEWTQQVLTDQPTRGTLPTFFADDTGALLSHEAALAALPAPGVTVVKDEMLKDEIGSAARRINVHIQPNQKAWQIRARLAGARVISASVNARPIEIDPRDAADGAREWNLRFFNPPDDGIWLTLEMAENKPLTLRSAVYVLGLPALAQGAAPPRPADVMPNHEGDLTLIARTIELPAHAK